MVSFVSRRTRELGIRVALGANKNDIYYNVLGFTVRPIAVGLVIGLGGGLVLIQTLRSVPFLPTLNTRDPLIYAAAVVLLAAVALAALIGPARRATRVDPAVVLRNE